MRNPLNTGRKSCMNEQMPIQCEDYSRDMQNMERLAQRTRIHCIPEPAWEGGSGKGVPEGCGEETLSNLEFKGRTGGDQSGTVNF